MHRSTLNAIFCTALIAFSLAACKSKPEAVYGPFELAAASYGRDLSFALVMQEVHSPAAEGAWEAVRNGTLTLGLEGPERCTGDLAACLESLRDHIGLQIGSERGARSQTVFEIQMDTALVALSVLRSDAGLTAASCGHMQARAATARLDASLWQPLCAMPAGTASDAVLNQLADTRESLATWVLERLDPELPFDAHPTPFAAVAAGSADLSGNR